MGGDALARCVGDPDQFLEQHWERDVHLHAGSEAGTLLDLDDVDALLAGAALRAPAFRLVQRGSPVPAEQYLRSARVGSRTIHDLIDPGRVHDLFADGATVVLQGLHRYWPPLTAFCRELEEALTHPVQANAYLTPPVASGLRVHADRHDVFALQTHGAKHWVAYPRGADLQRLPKPVLDTTIEPGDCLYVPRGAPHAARTQEMASLHITIGVRVTTWREALRHAVEDVLDDPAHAAALPPGYAADPQALAAGLRTRLEGLAAQLAKADPIPAAEATVDAYVRGRQPALAGQLRELLTVDEIGDDTELARRRGAVAALRMQDGQAALRLGDRLLLLPAHVEPAMRWVLERDRFRVGDLAELLDPPGRVALARRLVREGLLVRRG